MHDAARPDWRTDGIRGRLPGQARPPARARGALPDEGLGWVVGQAGGAIVAIEVEVSTGERLRASLGDSGWFAAWWPGVAEFRRASGFDATGALLGTTQ